MSQGFCKECAYLNITEDEQNQIKNQLKGKYYPDHICLKYDMKLYHLAYGVNWHPEIHKCEKCPLAYGYVYSRHVKNSFGEPAVIFIRPGSYLERELDFFNQPAERYEFLPAWL